MRDKVVTADEAVALIRSSDMIAAPGFGGIGTSEVVYSALERRFLRSGEPNDLGLLFAAGPGDGGDRGLNRLAHDGLIGRAIGGHWALLPKLAKMATDGRIEAWNLPLGCVSQLFREIAGRRPGLMSRVGIGTFVDPRLGGGRLNEISMDDLVEVIELDGSEWLFYKSLPVNVAIIRGTTADPDGNISMEREALVLDNLAIAMAAKACDGIVIVQVERLGASGALRAKDVEVPGVLVDCVVVAEPGKQAQTAGTLFNAAFSGELRVPLDHMAPLRLDGRKAIARRCAFELPMGGVVNLGIGIPEGVAAVAQEEHLLDHVTLTVEAGIIGGFPQGGPDFGAAINAGAIIPQNNQFDFYDGGGLDLACLGMAQVDAGGNVNVSRFGSHFAGAGGFINITQNTRRLVFAGTFTAGGLKLAVYDGTIKILKEGRSRKFIDAVDHITFNGQVAIAAGQTVLFVTERCVFELSADGLELTEIAPGIDLQTHILDLMEFAPIVNDPKLMDLRIFRAEPVGLQRDLLARPVPERFTFSPDRKTLFIDYAGYRVRATGDVEAIRAHVTGLLAPLPDKIDAVITYDGCTIDAGIVDAWFDMVRDVDTRFCAKSRRYTTSAFMRLKLGDALKKRKITPHVFESPESATP